MDNAGHTVDNQHGWPMSGNDAIEITFNKFFESNGMPDNFDDYMKRLRNPKITPAERIKLVDYWQNKDKL